MVTNQYTSSNIVLIALGANIPTGGSSLAGTLERAVSRIAAALGPITGKSPFYITPCFPAGHGPDYVNAAISLHTSEVPSKVLESLHKIEAEFGRTREVRWGERTLDLDLLGVGATILPDPETFETWRHLPLNDQSALVPDQLILPHPRIQDRAFVLVPLADVAPNWVHPVTDHTVLQMRDALPATDLAAVVRLPDTKSEAEPS